MKLNQNDRIYKYLLKQKIGGGNFGQVWVAEDSALERDVAVKILDESMAPVADTLKEAQVGNRLNHQNVVRVHYADVVQHNGGNLVLIAMDHHAAGSIISLANASNFLISPRARTATIDVLRGLEYLHEQQLFHNDIKPSNILIGSRSEALLTDYGISCVSPGLLPAPAPNAYVLHRAPETSSTNSISVATDIYQVGLTLFRLLNGIGLVREQKNRLGSQEFDRLKSVGKVPADDDFQPFVAGSLKRVVRKATHPDPALRYQSALEMRRALEKVELSGYWDAHPTGTLFGVFGGYHYSYTITRNLSGIILEAFKESTTSGRRTRVAAFSGKGMAQAEAKKKVTQFMIAVIEGRV